MRRFLIGLTLVLVILCFVKGSKGTTDKLESNAVSALNDCVDEHLARRLFSLKLGGELSLLLRD